MESYITSADAINLASKLSLAEIDIDLGIFYNDFKWFSPNELRSLLVFKLLYENPEEFLNQYKKNEPIENNNVFFDFDTQYPSYHKDSTCKRLLLFHNNYYKIPEDIRKKSPEEILQFRRWFKNKAHPLEYKQEILFRWVKLFYELEGDLKIEDFKDSNIEIIEKLNLDELENKIQELINDANEYYISTNKTKTILEHFGQDLSEFKDKININNTDYSNEDIRNVLKEFKENYKLPIITYIREYYRTKYNLELKFKTEILKQLGFIPCLHCCHVEYRRVFDSDYESSELKDINPYVLLRLYEDDIHIIFSFANRFNIDEADKYLRQLISSDEKNKSLNLFDEALKEGKAVIDIVNIRDNYDFDFSDQLSYCIADFLEFGKCRVFNKQTNQFAVKIEGTKFNDICCLAGSSGQTFLADGEELLEVIYAVG